MIRTYPHRTQTCKPDHAKRLMRGVLFGQNLKISPVFERAITTIATSHGERN